MPLAAKCHKSITEHTNHSSFSGVITQLAGNWANLLKKKCGYGYFASTCLTRKPKFRQAEAELPFFSTD